MQLTRRKSWMALEKHAQSRHGYHLSSFKDVNHRLSLHAQSTHINLDFTHQLMHEGTTLPLLCDLAHDRNLGQQIQKLFTGDYLNSSESRPALHTALRVMDEQPIYVSGVNIVPEILAVREDMRVIADKLRAGEWLGCSGEPITDIVNIGIGGSDLGPRFCIQALDGFTAKQLRYHFISDADPIAFDNIVEHLRPETTLFIICSKSFTTEETLYNARKSFVWFGHQRARDNHFIAVTAHPKRAQEFGISKQLPLWEWVGGRYSVCSAINLITVIAIGYEQFHEFLSGAHSMDTHFKSVEFEKNIPVLLALLGIWNNNFLSIHTLITLVYTQQLERLVPYLQQLDMESNGKSVDKDGLSVNYATGPIIWGGLGNQAQHSYYQLLCQGTHKIAADLISVTHFEQDYIHQLCLSNKLVLTEGILDESNPHNFIPGHLPLNHLSLKGSSPEVIGALVAMYEHKIFVQGVIWNINSFDQPGVEKAKRKVMMDPVEYTEACL